MNWDELSIVVQEVEPDPRCASVATLDACEARLGTKLPLRYREFALTAGAGWLARLPGPAGLWVRVTIPADFADPSPEALTERPSLEGLNEQHHGYGSRVPANEEGMSYERMVYFARDERPGGDGRDDAIPYYYGWDLDEVTDRAALDRAIYRCRLHQRRDWNDYLEWVAPNFERFVLDYCLGPMRASEFPPEPHRSARSPVVKFVADRGGMPPALPNLASPASPFPPGRTEVGLIRRSEHPPAPVAESWRRIEAWLAAHCPAVLTMLLPGATDEQVARFEQAIGQELPADLRESIQIHDGMRDGGDSKEPFQGEEPARDYFSPPLVATLLYEYRLDSIAPGPGRTSVLDRWRHWSDKDDRDRLEVEDALEDPYESYSSFPHRAIRCRNTCRGWLPLTNDGGNGNQHVGVDLDPGPNGVRGQVINFGRDEPRKVVLATSWAQFLEDYADELEAGNFLIQKLEPTNSYDDGERRLDMKWGRKEGVSTTFGRQLWAEAKLPEHLLALPVADPRLLPPDPQMAAACRAVVDQFVAATAAWHARWATAFRLADLGFQSITIDGETIRGNNGTTPAELTKQGLPVPEGVRFAHSRAWKNAAARAEFFGPIPIATLVARAYRHWVAIFGRYATKQAQVATRSSSLHSPRSLHLPTWPPQPPERCRVEGVFHRDERSAYVHCSPTSGHARRFLVKFEADRWRVDLYQTQDDDDLKIRTHSL